MRARAALLRVAAVVLGLAALFAALELGFRGRRALRERSGPREFWAVYEPALGYRINPGFGDINAHGLRDHPVREKGDRFRVLVLGDSVVYNGEDVDDTVVGRLRQRLREERGAAAIDVLNAGVRGYTNYQELLWLERYGLDLEPDLVGVAFVLNDLFRFLTLFRVEDGRIVGDGYDFTAEAVDGMGNVVYRTLRRSVFLVWLRWQLSAVDATWLMAGGDAFSFDHRPDFRTAWLDEPWQDIEAQLGRMRTLGREHGFRLFVAVFPFGDQYRDDYLARDRAYVLAPQARLRAICARLGIPCLDLYPVLDPAADIGTDRIHLTARGRRRAGEEIAEFLLASGLLPAP